MSTVVQGLPADPPQRQRLERAGRVVTAHPDVGSVVDDGSVRLCPRCPVLR